MLSLEVVSAAVFEEIAGNRVYGSKENNKDSTHEGKQ